MLSIHYAICYYRCKGSLSYDWIGALRTGTLGSRLRDSQIVATFNKSSFTGLIALFVSMPLEKWTK